MEAPRPQTLEAPSTGHRTCACDLSDVWSCKMQLCNALLSAGWTCRSLGHDHASQHESHLLYACRHCQQQGTPWQCCLLQPVAQQNSQPCLCVGLGYPGEPAGASASPVQGSCANHSSEIRPSILDTASGVLQGARERNDRYHLILIPGCHLMEHDFDICSASLQIKIVKAKGALAMLQMLLEQKPSSALHLHSAEQCIMSNQWTGCTRACAMVQHYQTGQTLPWIWVMPANLLSVDCLQTPAYHKGSSSSTPLVLMSQQTTC